MIETTISEINVSDLMERVRSKAAEIQKMNTRVSSPSVELRRMQLPSRGVVLLPPPLVLPKAVPSRRERILAMLGQAREKTEVSSWIPKPVRRFFRKQGGYNRILLESVAVLAKANAELTRGLEQLTACVGAQQQWLNQFQQYSINQIDVFRQNVQEQLDVTSSNVSAGLVEFREKQERIRTLDEEISRNSTRVSALQKNVEELFKGFQALRGDGEHSGEHVRNLQKEVERNTAAETALQKGFDELLKGFQALRTQGEHAGEHLRNLQSETTRNIATAESLRREVDRIDERLTTEGAFLRAKLSSQDSLMQRWMDGKTEASGPLRKLTPTQKEPAPVFDERFDAFYMSFEDRFRGSRNEIKERISFYLPYVWESNAGTADRPILDLGCGRGEWLELLREVGANARGVDINLAMLALCRRRNLDVIQADALEFLRSLPDNSLGAVTGFHIIEHLPFATLMDIFGEAQRVVEPGGFVIFESPNCKNLIVGASNFNIDPTHRNPVFPETAEFMLNSHGFQNVELQYLSSVTAAQFEGRTRQAVVLNELLYGPQDFAVIGHKSAAG